MYRTNLYTPNVESSELFELEFNLLGILVEVFRTVDDFELWKDTFVHTMLRGLYPIDNFPPYNTLLGNQDILDIMTLDKYADEKLFGLKLYLKLKSQFQKYLQLDSQHTALELIHVRIRRIQMLSSELSANAKDIPDLLETPSFAQPWTLSKKDLLPSTSLATWKIRGDGIGGGGGCCSSTSGCYVDLVGGEEVDLGGSLVTSGDVKEVYK